MFNYIIKKSFKYLLICLFVFLIKFFVYKWVIYLKVLVNIFYLYLFLY